MSDHIRKWVAILIIGQFLADYGPLKSPLTTLTIVSSLFISMIPSTVKLQFFSLYLFVYFFIATII